MHPRESQMAKRKPKPPQTGDRSIVGLRIIGGRFRGRRLRYSGDPRTRPMKDRLREAIFNLVGPAIRGAHAIDLFAGTGALGLEAISRGAARATLIEQHNPTARLIRDNIAVLGADQQAEVIIGNTFIWWRRASAQSRDQGSENLQISKSPNLQTPNPPWAVFFSPPYDFFVDRIEEMLELIRGMLEAAPAGSMLIVEADSRFDFSQLPDPKAWDVRAYSPAVVGIYHKE